MATQTLFGARVNNDQPGFASRSLAGLEGFTPDIVAVIPAFNEERFIGSVVLQARRYAMQVIVVDDGSQDNTALVAADAGAEVVPMERNSGKASALAAGFAAARSFRPDVVVVLDADGQHRPEELPLVVRPVLTGEADIVVGSRYLENTSQVPRHRVLGHWLFNLLTGSASGLTVSDSQSGYRAFSPQALEALSFRSEGFSVESEMQFIASDSRLRLVEVPITIRYTDKPKRSVLVHGVAVLNGVLRMIGQYRPLLFFGVTGILLMSVGVGLGLWVVERFRQVHQLAIGYALISVMLSILGLVLTSTGVTLHSMRGLLNEMRADLKQWAGRRSSW